MMEVVTNKMLTGVILVTLASKPTNIHGGEGAQLQVAFVMLQETV
jgi:hypothetical protein